MHLRLVIVTMLCVALWWMPGCRRVENAPYRWTSTQVASLDNSGRDAIPVADGAPIPAVALALRLRFTSQIGTSGSSPASSDADVFHYNVDSVRTFAIVRLAAPGSSAAALDITDDFRARDRHRAASIDQFVTPRDYFKPDNRYAWPIDSLDFILVEHAQPGDSVRFAVALVLSSGTTLTDTTDVVTLR